MNTPEFNSATSTGIDNTASNVADFGMTRLEKLAKRPNNIKETGLSESFLSDLVAKHLLDGGVLTLSDLTERVALSGPILEAILDFMRAEARVEIRGMAADGSVANLRYALTERGHQSAQDAMLRSGYVGPAPVPLKDYVKVAQTQTVHGRNVNAEDMKKAFAGVVLRDEIRDKVGPALNSGRAIFIYGHAGTGKTYITQQLVRLFPDETLIPFAIAVNENVVEVFDPVLHRIKDTGVGKSNIMLTKGHDPRYACCERPAVISGGELTADMLDIHYDHATKRYQAPLQLKANNGVFIIDDMGRQRIAPEVVFNRWIVPLEEKKDYLTLGAGRHFSVPFDVVLIFSTNLRPTDIADEAFLRRIGYKIEFPTLTPDEYRQIWNGYCANEGISVDDDVFDYVVNGLHKVDEVPLLPCHPRDLLSIAADWSAYEGHARNINREAMAWAWQNYFVLSRNNTDAWHSPAQGGGIKS
jgi:predicted ATPase with chaperone activity